MRPREGRLLGREAPVCLDMSDEVESHRVSSQLKNGNIHLKDDDYGIQNKTLSVLCLALSKGQLGQIEFQRQRLEMHQ